MKIVWRVSQKGAQRLSDRFLSVQILHSLHTASRIQKVGEALLQQSETLELCQKARLIAFAPEVHL